MKSLNSFINEAGRGRPRKNADLDSGIRDVDLDYIKGKKADNNGTKGAMYYDEPTDDKAQQGLDKAIKKGFYTKEELNRNTKRLLMKFKTREPFMIYGEAGWGKSEIVKGMAKRFGMKVITLNIDKIEATDLKGIPVPVQRGKRTVQEMAFPSWALSIFDNPDQEYLLFLDEMNQATPDVMNALMPIVHEQRIGEEDDEKGKGLILKNMFVGAAGNYDYENSAVSELSGPLKSRFKPIINWECGTPEAWKSATDYMSKKWENNIPASVLGKVVQYAPYFVNPREVELKILQFTDRMRTSVKEDGDADSWDVDIILDRLESLCREDLNRSEKEELKKLAETLYFFIIGKDEESSSTGRSRSKGADMIPEEVKKQITKAIRLGYITGEPEGKNKARPKYGISKENINKIFCTDEYGMEPINKEMLDRLISKIEADGIKFRYDTNSQFLKDGMKDPDADDEV
jgi:MoxR-like ATPase